MQNKILWLALTVAVFFSNQTWAQAEKPSVGNPAMPDSVPKVQFSLRGDSLAIADGQELGFRETESPGAWFVFGFLAPGPGLAGAITADPGKPPQNLIAASPNPRLFIQEYRNSKRQGRLGYAIAGGVFGNVCFQSLLNAVWGIGHGGSNEPVPWKYRLTIGTLGIGGFMFIIKK